MLWKITIIWRPNVGKSSFFNMFTGHKIAVVADEAGTTRDISEFEYTDKDREITYIVSDSWGLDFSSDDQDINSDILDRTIKAINESDLLIWLIEYSHFTQMDHGILKILIKNNAPNFILVANKCDNEDKVMQSYSLAWKGELDFFPISTSHNSWIKEIKDFTHKFFKEKWLNYFVEELDEKIIKLSLVWRPNVWKSSLINSITWKDRVMVKDLSWTTRDSIDTKFESHWEEFVLIDTAWIRRLSKIWTRNIENWSVMRTTRAINRSDVVAVVIDWIDWVVHQDLAIISKVLEEKKWLIIVVNKWDKVLAKPWTDKEKMMDKYMAYLQAKIEFISYAPVVFSSATENKRVEEIIENALEIKKERNKRVKTSIFNEFLEQVIYKHSPTWNKKSHSPKIYYWSQVDTSPPKFILTVNNPKHFHFSYKRYLENRIRENFWFHGTPIIITYKWRWKHKDVVK